jgi:hypothetical protein
VLNWSAISGGQPIFCGCTGTFGPSTCPPGSCKVSKRYGALIGGDGGMTSVTVTPNPAGHFLIPGQEDATAASPLAVTNFGLLQSALENIAPSVRHCCSAAARLPRKSGLTLTRTFTWETDAGASVTRGSTAVGPSDPRSFSGRLNGLCSRSRSLVRSSAFELPGWSVHDADRTSAVRHARTRHLARYEPSRRLPSAMAPIGSQGRGAVAGPVPHPPFDLYVRFSRTQLTDGLLDMVTPPSGIGRCP